MASTTRPQTTANTAPHRLPAPALFTHQQQSQRPSTPPRGLSVSTNTTTTAPSAPSPSATRAPPPTRAQIDATFATLQRTLDDVERAATSRAPDQPRLDARPFGDRHDAALAGLRMAQVQLAEAWGPTGRAWDGDGVRPPTDEGGKGAEEDGEEQAEDRRRGDERYFRLVREGMRDVVGRLEEVGRRMREVEGVGRGVWSEDGESV